MNENWHWLVQLFFLLAPFIIGLIGQAMVVHMALTRDRAILVATFSRSRYVTSKAWMAESGVLARMVFILSVAGIVAIPGPGVKKGMVSAADLQTIPAGLKRKLITSVGLIWVALTWLIIAAQML